MSARRWVTAVVGALLLLPAFLFPQQILCIGADGHVQIESAASPCCGEEREAPAHHGMRGECGGCCGACVDIPCDPPRFPLPSSPFAASDVPAPLALPAGPFRFALPAGRGERPAPPGPPLFLAHRSLLI